MQHAQGCFVAGLRPPGQVGRYPAVLLWVVGVILDGGQIARNTACCLLVLWPVFVMTAARRPLAPTAVDLWIIKWASVPLFIFAVGYGWNGTP
jgi:hypothetical protein